MSDKPLFPEGVEVHAAQLQFEAQQREFHIQRRFADETRSGRASGLAIVIGSPTSRFTLGAGYGYTPRGDYAETPGSINVALADYTSGVENLFVLAYRENLGTPEAHEDGGATRNTIASRSSEIKVITRDEYNGMAASADGDFATNLQIADLTTDARDRLVILASILGKGFSGGSPVGYVVGDFSNGNIVQQPLFPVILSAALPTVPLISGMNIKAVSIGSSLGIGSLVLTVTSPTVKAITWQAPNDGSPGASQTIDLTQPLVAYTLPSSTSSETITVELVPNLLPPANGTYTDAVTIAVYYDDLGPVFSTRDDLHRSKMGSYVPTPAMPHGEGYPDFAQQVAVIPRPALLGTGALASAVQAREARITTPRSIVDGANRTLMWAISAGDYTIRFYKVDTDALEITANARWDGSNWNRDSTTSGTLSSLLRMGANTTFAQTGLDFFIYTDSPNTFPDLNFLQVFQTNHASSVLALGEGFLSGTDMTKPRVNAKINGRTLMWRSLDRSVSSVSGVRIYMGQGIFELALNATWAGTLWSKDDTTAPSTLVKVDNSTVTTRYKVVGAGSWNDSGWTDVAGGNIQVDLGAGTIVTKGSIQSGQQFIAGALASTDPALARFFTAVDTSSVYRYLISEQNVGSFRIRRFANNFVGGDHPFGSYEETINARWTGTQWDFDDATAGAFLWRYGPRGVTSYYHVAGHTHPWADSDSGWELRDFELGHAGSGAEFAAAVGIPNPNRLFSDNIPKAWGTITYTNVTGTAVVTLTEQFNIDTPTKTGNAVIVPFLSGATMATTTYPVLTSVAFPNEVTGGDTVVTSVQVHTKSSTGFRLSLMLPTGIVPSLSGFDTGNEGVQANFVVFGRQ